MSTPKTDPYAQARTRREIGIIRSTLGADRAHEAWPDEAFAHLCMYAARRRKAFTIEEFREDAEREGLPHPPDARAYGGVTHARAARRRHSPRRLGAGEVVEPLAEVHLYQRRRAHAADGAAPQGQAGAVVMSTPGTAIVASGSTGNFTPARYDAMVTAIAECHRVDEVKDLRDKAVALQVYARQAKNTDAERKAADIRLRAERRCGELFRDMARADKPNPAGLGGKSRKAIDTSRSGTHQPPSPYARALEESGISRQEAHRYQQLAEVPQKVFDDALADPVAHPTARKIVREAAATPAPQIDTDALRVWGIARAWERHRESSHRARELLENMTETMRDDMRRLAPLIAEYWTRMAEEVAR